MKTEVQNPTETVERSVDCRERRVEKPKERLCYICNKPGHLARNCPEKDTAPKTGDE